MPFKCEIDSAIQVKGVYRNTPYEYIETASAQCFIKSISKQVPIQGFRAFQGPPSIAHPQLPNWMITEKSQDRDSDR